jgi:hypothetical protein
MSPFQIVLLVVLGGMIAFIAQAVVRGRLGRPAGAVWLLILGVGIVAAIDPNRTTTIARSLGISRGSDLLLYVLVLAVLQGFLVFYLRLRRVRRELTILVRRLAIMEAPMNRLADAPSEDGGTDRSNA